MPDRFTDTSASLSGPAASGFGISPSDTVDLPETTRALYVGTAGNLRVAMKSGDILTFSGVLAGTVLPVRVSRVFATQTTAGGLVGLV